MSQHNNVARQLYNYTRIDYAALRFLLNDSSLYYIYNLYNEDDLLERGIESDQDLRAWLEELRDHLAARAKAKNPLIARLLDDARARNRWGRSVADYLVNAAEGERAKPSLSDSVSLWFKPIVSKVLTAEGLKTLGALKTYIEARGAGWYRPIPRIGVGKALVLQRWFESNAGSLGSLQVAPEVVTGELILDGGARQLLPLDRIKAIAAGLDGSQGANRSPLRALVSASNDLEAVSAYLYRYREPSQAHTLRAYRKELERFLLWCVVVRRKALSSVLLDDCEAYKDFLAAPAADWIGPRCSKRAPQWRPFSGPLQPASQRYAVLVLHGFFDWLMKVRYLGGNPWVTVAAPRVEEPLHRIKIQKALPPPLWSALVAPEGILDQLTAKSPERRTSVFWHSRETGVSGAQARLARAVLHLVGATGLRRAEAAGALRSNFAPVLNDPDAKRLGTWMLAVRGKRGRWREVPVPREVVEAIREHWQDRGLDFDRGAEPVPLFSPLVIQSPAAKRKHLAQGGSDCSATIGYSPDALYAVLKRALIAMAANPELPLSAEERQMLSAAATHAFRHTFATRAANIIQLSVLRVMLGHASLDTTSIYTNPAQSEVIRASVALFSRS